MSDNARLMAEWDYSQNVSAGITPETTTLSSKSKVFWLCAKGHAWSASVASRYYKGAGGPICAKSVRAKSRRKALVMTNGSLADNYPEIAVEWHYVKNGDETPEHISAGCNEKFWWKCRKCGNEWQARIANRKNGTGCPECASLQAGKKHTQSIILSKGSLKDNYPDIASEWHFEKNKTISPQDVVAGSAQKVWWKCSKCGHDWVMAINKRTTRGSGIDV